MEEQRPLETIWEIPDDLSVSHKPPSRGVGEAVSS